ncbi:HD domain-containing protein [Halalkalibacter krulwichiae]|uniref:Putative nicotinate-nucleotide adenylyltransferase n=1 Tax=Halalkalibacter krulwichiae TaxID=199441 RepID=A0A1X9MDE7_9BACI|nr:HD domain-containing protein [Halalkalibacter krulwichiae]ARK31469.1 putative nicotinate-nucleotide adenylyltransferase [Halalkalibacter krulwichiae]
MRHVTLVQLFDHPITQKYVKRSGMAHAVACAYHAFRLSQKYEVDPDLATKAAFLHDIGHYTWYRDGKWDYALYKENDIHAIKGSERAHKLLIRLGEHPRTAKEIALAILLHTDSYLPDGYLKLNPLQHVVAMADSLDEEPGGEHHYRKISDERARKMLIRLDDQINSIMNPEEMKRSI